MSSDSPRFENFFQVLGFFRKKEKKDFQIDTEVFLQSQLFAHSCTAHKRSRRRRMLTVQRPLTSSSLASRMTVNMRVEFLLLTVRKNFSLLHFFSSSSSSSSLQLSLGKPSFYQQQQQQQQHPLFPSITSGAASSAKREMFKMS